MQRLIVTTLYLLSILIPLTFTTINYELFEFPKFILLLSGTLIITIAWAAHIYHRKDLTFFSPETPKALKLLHYSVLAVLATQILATIFSINPYTSLWGYYSRFHGGLLTTICYTIIYFSVVKWLDNKSTQKLIKITIGTALVISVYAILEHYGIDKNLWKQDVQNRVFSTLGQPHWLAAYVIPNLFLTFYFHASQKNQKNNWLYYGIYIIFFATLLFTKSRSGFLALSLSLVTYLALTLRTTNIAAVKKWFTPYLLISVLLLLIYGSPFSNSLSSYLQAKNNPIATPIAQGTALETGGTESGDIRKIVWSGALALIQKYPLLGTGPETFGYTYYWTRPASHNATSEWDFIYNKAHNEYLNMAAGAGLLGLLGYLSWHWSLLAASWLKVSKSKKVNNYQGDNLRAYLPVLAASVVSFTVTNFFGFSVIPVYFLMIVIGALATTLNQETEQRSDLPVGAYPMITILIVIALALTGKIWLADYYFTVGKARLDALQPAAAITDLSRAIKLRPGLDLFHAFLGESYATLAASANASGDEGIKAQTEKYLQLAVTEAERTKELNPHHLNYFKSRAKIYLTLATVDANFNNRAVIELAEARELAPTDPKLAYNLGLVYTRLNKLDKAEEQLKDAVALKPNYPDPYYALTLLYEQTKQTAKIPELLTGAKTNLATYSAQLKEKIDLYSP
jgi:putative inorganic carbon (HCO3(-)) transporter